MASTFKNAGMAVVTTDNSSANLYTAGGSTSVEVQGFGLLLISYDI